MRARLAPGVAEPVLFVLKHLWAGLFGGVLMVAIAATGVLWEPDWPLQRYDALFVIALATQAAFLWLRIETRGEFAVMMVYGLLGLGMEWFKVLQGEWSYPDGGLFTLFDVPLFVGFMYAAVAGCILRMIRLFEMRFAPFPPYRLFVLLAVAIYANFFTRHLMPDLRLALFALSALILWRTRIWFRVGGRDYRMPMLLSLVLAATGVWLAENLGTLTGTWLYADQSPGTTVGLGLLGSWYLFLLVAFATVTPACREALLRGPLFGAQR